MCNGLHEQQAFVHRGRKKELTKVKKREREKKVQIDELLAHYTTTILLLCTTPKWNKKRKKQPNNASESATRRKECVGGCCWPCNRIEGRSISFHFLSFLTLSVCLRERDKLSINYTHLCIFCIVKRPAFELKVAPSPSLEGRRLLHQESLTRANL